ncbi:MAG: tetratricopeptide repeat protein, partial [Planctomycetota bacterium]
MNRKDKTNRLTKKRKTLFLALVFGLALLMGSTADGKPRLGKKNLPCKTLRSMARVYMAFGDYTKALTLAEQALTMARAKNVSDSELALCVIDLAYIYDNQGRLSEAEKMCELGLKLQQKAYYEKHPYIAYTLRTLSSIYQKQGKYRDARLVLERAIAIMLDSHSADDKAMAPFKVEVA